ncbi:MAG: DUF1552 domain-containing protein [Planctomycetota bacterium]|nr:DUF1552 domain-containing protein [Planctomycetota bacterium]
MPLSRRQLLRAGGACVALPCLPSFTPRRLLGPPARKLVIVYIPNGVVRRRFFPGEEEAEIPGFVGGFDADKTKSQRRTPNEPGSYAHEWSSSLAPLQLHSDDVTLVTGLERTYKNGQDVHAQASSAYLTSLSPVQAAERGIAHPNGRTLDHVIGDRVGQGSVLKTLEVSCNGFSAPKEDIYFNNISWYGPGQIAPSIKDPRRLYERLFRADGYRRHLDAVTDLVLADARSLAPKLAGEDRVVLDEFLGMVRDVEVRIERLEALIQNTDLQEPPETRLPRGEYIRLQADLMLLALQMGITNVCTFMIGPERWDATLRYESIFPAPVQHHNLTHNQQGDGYKPIAAIDRFHVAQFAYVLSRMKSMREADGSCLLDNSLLTYGAGIGDGATHQFFDLPMVLAGRGQGEVRHGRLLKLRSGTLTSNLWLSLARWMGLELESFADSTGEISELWS